MERVMTTEPKRRTQRTTPRERNAEKPRSSRRKPAEFSVPIKLWVSDEMYKAIEKIAREREWSVPQVLRACARIVLGERKLG
jgi:hypothetical protein